MTETENLSTYRWNNDIKSAFLVAAFPCLIIGLVALYYFVVAFPSFSQNGFVPESTILAHGYLTETNALPLLSYVEKNTWAVAPYVLLIAALWVLIGLLFHESLMRWATQAESLSRKESPEIYNTLENLCIASGTRMPKLYVMKRGGINAFSSGLTPQTYAITLSQGIIDKLSKDEIEAVLAHELTHILNHDVRLLLATVLLGSLFSFLPESLLLFSYAIINAEELEGDANLLRFLPFILFFMARSLVFVLCFGYIGTLVFRASLSKSREFVADAGAIALTKNPEALLCALKKVREHVGVSHMPCGINAMLFNEPPKWVNLLRTHPSIEDRIAAIQRTFLLPTSRIPKNAENV